MQRASPSPKFSIPLPISFSPSGSALEWSCLRTQSSVVRFFCANHSRFHLIASPTDYSFTDYSRTDLREIRSILPSTLNHLNPQPPLLRLRNGMLRLCYAFHFTASL